MWSQESGQIVYVVETQNAAYESQVYGPGLHSELDSVLCMPEKQPRVEPGPDSKYTIPFDTARRS